MRSKYRRDNAASGDATQEHVDRSRQALVVDQVGRALVVEPQPTDLDHDAPHLAATVRAAVQVVEAVARELAARRHGQPAEQLAVAARHEADRERADLVAAGAARPRRPGRPGRAGPAGGAASGTRRRAHRRAGRPPARRGRGRSGCGRRARRRPAAGAARPGRRTGAARGRGRPPATPAGTRTGRRAPSSPRRSGGTRRCRATRSRARRGARVGRPTRPGRRRRRARAPAGGARRRSARTGVVGPEPRHDLTRRGRQERVGPQRVDDGPGRGALSVEPVPVGGHRPDRDDRVDRPVEEEGRRVVVGQVARHRADGPQAVGVRARLDRQRPEHPACDTAMRLVM